MFDIIEADDDFELIAGCYRPVSEADRAYRGGLAQGRAQARLDVPRSWATSQALRSAFVKGHAAARWEVEGSFIAH